MKKISIVCPIRNERDNLKELINRIYSSLGEYFIDNTAELILVDDGSTDDSFDIMRKLSKEFNGIKIITHNTPMGQATALSSGLEVAAGEIVIIMNGDLQVFPEDIILFIKKMEEGYDVVNGIRIKRRDILLFKISTKFLGLLIKIFFDISVKDPSSNFLAVRNKFINDIKLKFNDHRYIIPILYNRGARKIGEVGVRHKLREKGKSKYKLSKPFFAIPEFIGFCIREFRGRPHV
ncbi:MAG: glycosyltransferase [Candidatus Omnitrophica bacterium]|nr:glycosyltransferase [bacterium]MCG2713902.1 glycosyltransferase [Candidatus Omnitrophota bacterium]